ncbi:hypothetical protein PMIN02_005413 [Paraphaeosphaeria minitans]
MSVRISRPPIQTAMMHSSMETYKFRTSPMEDRLRGTSLMFPAASTSLSTLTTSPPPSLISNDQARIQEAREADEVDEVDEADDADDADEDGCHGDEVVECNDLAASSYNPAAPRATTMASDDLPTARSKSCD